MNKRNNPGITVWFSLNIFNTGFFNFMTFLWNNFACKIKIYPLEALLWPQWSLYKQTWNFYISACCNINLPSRKLFLAISNTNFDPLWIFLSPWGRCLNSKALPHMIHCAKVEIGSVDSEKPRRRWKCEE